MALPSLQGRLGTCSAAGHITVSNKSRVLIRRKEGRILERHPMESVTASMGEGSVGRASEPTSCKP